MIFWIEVFLVFLLLYYTLLRPKLYWWYKNVKQGIPIPLFGDSLFLFLQTKNEIDLCNRGKDDARYHGLYFLNTPILVIKDSDLVKQITMKGFDHFPNHITIIDETVDPVWGKNIASLKGEKWRQMRAILTPAFTSGKMRSMFTLVNDCARQVADYYLSTNENQLSIELKDIAKRYGNDVIANCAFGLAVDSFRQPDNEFYRMSKKLTNLDGILRKINVALCLMFPTFAKWLGITFFPKHVSKYLQSLICDTIAYREKHDVFRPDMVNLLMEAIKKQSAFMKEGNEYNHAITAETSTENSIFSELDLAAQAMVFISGGLGTQSAVISCMAHELAVNREIQMKLIDEIDTIRHQCKEDITYNVMNESKYMDMVINETLRKWPPVYITNRQCEKPYVIRQEARNEKPILVDKGTPIYIPIYLFHYNKKFFPNPEIFDPERFSESNRDNIKPGTFIPFGLGPRNCIASRFAFMEVKTFFYHILSKFELKLIDKTQLPLKTNIVFFSLVVDHDMWIGLERRKI